MGYIKHHTIVVTSWNKEKIKDVHKKAKDIFKEEFAKDTTFKKDGSLLVSSILEGQINFCYSFFVAPDGSKEGWTTSDLGDKARQRLVDYIKTRENSDGSNAIKFVEVYFGEDKGKCEIESHN